jgi:carboxymethylenebutenolidase
MDSLDLVALWEAHCRYEFETRDVDATMATMVEQPYVNHIPTMTGGVGHDQLKRFYKYHFIGINPPDFRLTPISRTVGTDSVVDEFIVHFTHTTEIDWLLPGVPPTGRIVEVGLLDPTSLPVAGVQTARKVMDKSQPSNELMARWAESEGKKL